MDKESLALLRRIGLNQYESRIYLALLSHGSASAGDISDLANIPRPRTYDVLEKLRKSGFVNTQPGRPTKFGAVGVKEAFSSLKSRKSEDLEKEIKELDKIQYKLIGAVKEVELDYGSSTDMVWVLKDRKNIYSKIDALIKNATTSILIASSDDGLKRKLEMHGDSLKKAKKRGVDIKIMSPKDSRFVKEAARFAKVIPKDHTHRFVIADDNVMLFLTPEENPKNEVGAWIKSPYFAQNVRKLI